MAIFALHYMDVQRYSLLSQKVPYHCTVKKTTEYFEYIWPVTFEKIMKDIFAIFLKLKVSSQNTIIQYMCFNPQ